MSARAGPSRVHDDTAAANAATTSSTGSDGGGGPGGVGSSGSGNAAGTAAGKKRSRVSRACDACYARKDRCDGGQPVCKVCRDLERRCTYDRPERKRGPLQGVRQRLEAQIETLESVLGYLVDSFPHLSHDALRPLMLDDGAAAMVKAESDAHRESPSTAAAAGPSRLPLGNIYPYYSKAHAKEVWRHSDFARSIAPSLGLRLGLLDDEEDVMESSAHHARVEEARRARARLVMSTPPAAFVRESHISGISNRQHEHHIHGGGAFNGNASFSLPSLHADQQHAHLQHAAMMHQTTTATAPPTDASIVPHDQHHAGGIPVSTTTATAPMSESSALHGSRGVHSEAMIDMDPFATQWSHDSFDLGNLGEGGHALAYALGLPTAADTGGGSGSYRAHSTFTFGTDHSSADVGRPSAEESYAASTSTQNSIPSVFAHAFPTEGLSPPVPGRPPYTYAEHDGSSSNNNSSASHVMMSSLAGGSGNDDGMHSSPIGGRTLHDIDGKLGGNFDAGLLHGAAQQSPLPHSHHYPHQHHRSEPASNILYQLGLQDSL